MAALNYYLVEAPLLVNYRGLLAAEQAALRFTSAQALKYHMFHTSYLTTTHVTIGRAVLTSCASTSARLPHNVHFAIAHCKSQAAGGRDGASQSRGQAHRWRMSLSVSLSSRACRNTPTVRHSGQAASGGECCSSARTVPSALAMPTELPACTTRPK